MPLYRKLQIGSHISGSTSGSILFADSSNFLAQDNGELFWDNTNNRLGIGTTSPAARVEIETDSATEVGAIIMAAASQSAALLQAVDSSGNVVTSINSAGNITLCTDARTHTSSATTKMIDFSSTQTVDYNNASITCFNFTPTVIYEQVGNLFSSFTVFNGAPILVNAPSEANNLGLTFINLYGPTFRADGATITALGNTNYQSSLNVSRINSGAYTLNSHVDFTAGGGPGVGAGCTLTTRTGFYANNLTNGGTFTTQIGLDVASLTAATTNIAIRTGTGGDIQFGNKITKYNNISTVSGGVPSELATVDLTAQGAAIAATTLYAVPASGAGRYRVNWVASVTRAATTSSVLGGANGFQLKYTDADDSVVKTSNPTTVTAFTSAGNTTATSVSGSFIANCKASTNLQYLFDYASVGATTMQYNLHIVVEAL